MVVIKLIQGYLKARSLLLLPSVVFGQIYILPTFLEPKQCHAPPLETLHNLWTLL